MVQVVRTVTDADHFFLVASVHPWRIRAMLPTVGYDLRSDSHRSFWSVDVPSKLDRKRNSAQEHQGKGNEVHRERSKESIRQEDNNGASK